MEKLDFFTMDEILEKNKWSKNKIVGILQDIQEKFNYLPKEVLFYISEKLKIPLSEIYSIVTFYKAFNLNPQGKYVIEVCLGTACHVRGGEKIVKYLENKWNIKAGETTKDGKYTLKTVNCLGCCAIGPVVVVNGKYYSSVNLSKIEKIIKEND